MSWYEYNDMFEKAQKIGKYHIYILDIVGSRDLSREKYIIAHRLQRKLLSTVYNRIMEIEIERKSKILHNIDIMNRFGFTCEPIIFGDLIGFTVLRDSIEREVIYNIITNLKYSMNITEKYHFADGFYETDDWKRALMEYYRGYCIQYLEFISKQNKIKI